MGDWKVQAGWRRQQAACRCRPRCSEAATSSTVAGHAMAGSRTSQAAPQHSSQHTRAAAGRQQRKRTCCSTWSGGAGGSGSDSVPAMNCGRGGGSGGSEWVRGSDSTQAGCHDLNCHR